jgi:hypothetical protein
MFVVAFPEPACEAGPSLRRSARPAVQVEKFEGTVWLDLTSSEHKTSCRSWGAQWHRPTVLVDACDPSQGHDDILDRGLWIGREIWRLGIWPFLTAGMS